MGPANKPPDPHEYVIFGWQDVAREQFDGFVALIRAEGYRGRYTPPYDPSKTMTNDWFPIHEEPRTRRQVPPRAPGKG